MRTVGHAVCCWYVCARPLTAAKPHVLAAAFGAAARLAGTKASAENVKRLREQTSLSLMLCRKALDNSGNDVAKAMQWLQENEAARAECVCGGRG